MLGAKQCGKTCFGLFRLLLFKLIFRPSLSFLSRRTDAMLIALYPTHLFGRGITRKSTKALSLLFIQETLPENKHGKSCHSCTQPDLIYVPIKSNQNIKNRMRVTAAQDFNYRRVNYKKKTELSFLLQTHLKILIHSSTTLY